MQCSTLIILLYALSFCFSCIIENKYNDMIFYLYFISGRYISVLYQEAPISWVRPSRSTALMRHLELLT